MNILYLGSFPPDFLVDRSGGKIDSLYRDDKAIIAGLMKQPSTRVEVITSPDIPSWPHGPFFIRHEVNAAEGVTMVSHLNIPLVKQPWSIFTMVREAGRYIRTNKEKTVVVIPYIVFRHVVTLRLLKRLYGSKVVQASIVPDIFFPSNIILKHVNSFTEKMAKKFDAFVLYTPKMAQHLQVPDDSYEVIEGFRTIPNFSPVISSEFKVVYAGSLSLNYGIGRLIEAMGLLKTKDIQLHLYGSGTAESLITDVSKKNNQIVFHGRVPNSEAVDAIYSASVLINPRNADDGDYTEYSFPSKDIEYMATGIPTLLCKLPGMPQEYYGHFIDIKDGQPEQIADAILTVYEMSQEERESIGNDSRDFIMDRMNCLNQGARIVNLFSRFI